MKPGNKLRFETIIGRLSLVLLTGITLLGGFVKLTLYSREVALYQGVGFTDNNILTFGVFQSLGGIFLLFPKTRYWGASISTLSFAFSTFLAITHGYIDIALTLGVVVLVGSYVTYREINGTDQVQRF